MEATATRGRWLHNRSNPMRSSGIALSWPESWWCRAGQLVTSHGDHDHVVVAAAAVFLRVGQYCSGFPQLAGPVDAVDPPAPR
jgi:hypothetical protein